MFIVQGCCKRNKERVTHKEWDLILDGFKYDLKMCYLIWQRIQTN